MLVDNPLYQQSFFSSSSSYPEYPTTDLNDIFDTELFNNTFATGSSIQSSTPSGSRGSTPQNLLTPPQGELPTSFPEIHDEESSSNHGLFTIFEDDLKTIDPLSIPSNSNDFMSAIDNMYGAGGMNGYGIDMSGYGGIPMDLSGMGVGMNLMDDSMQAHGIDPQLVDTPSAVSDNGEDESDEKESPPSPPSPVVVEKQEPEKPTIIIAPVKVGGHGKARKGTVQSGGVVKKSSSSSASREKENSITTFSSSTSSSKKAAAQTKATTSSTSSGLFNAGSTSGSFLTGGGSAKADSEAGDAEDDDDLPQDWRPSPEVFAKMTSKEKRQLRNKISARNFRVRRKGDIAERDRMLDHFRTQLGSTESENHALRQEIAALKKALLDGRSGPINLPPPAPLPEQSAAEALAASASSSSTPSTSTSSPLLTANTQKDLPTSPRMGNRFWGGVGIGGGFTPVHTTLVPDISTLENMNPNMNAQPHLGGVGLGGTKGLGGFDGFSDLNPFTMKTLDAYRMDLWGKMAAQHHTHQQSQQAQHHLSNSMSNSGLASNLRPLYFSASNKPNLPSAYGGTALSALLSGKHIASSSSSSSSYTPPSSSSSQPGSPQQQQREKEHQQAMLAAMASQTVFRKLGSAFWDAFTGSSSSSSSPLSTSSASPSSHAMYHHPGNWDQDKVQRVLEGKAVLRVVDVEPPTTASSASPPISTPSPTPAASAAPASPRMSSKRCGVQDESGVKKCMTAAAVCDILEESMRSLTLGKGA
ncbi:hypothetical protein M413DRAFT_20462 [Hebeloma cylindrosporum]|uniref:BZIP domain-containing protein n=1 Tax=Hebeloma cylindrosporum TaxID=76867 RepID=A0A0C3BJ08_HEBCY|nr:hypothetical protein M413DRAFT_20462 [Hebeloma cylindrosporum h7]